MPDKSDTAKAAELLKHRPARPRPQHTKDRSWEKAQRTAEHTTQVSYRGMPRNLNEAMKEIARVNGMNVSQIAVRFMAYAMHRYGIVSLEKMAEFLAEWERSASG